MRLPNTRAADSLLAVGSALTHRPSGIGSHCVGALLMSLTLASSSGAASFPGAATAGTVGLEPALKSAMDARDRANREGDVAQIEALMAPEYVQTDIGGRV